MRRTLDKRACRKYAAPEMRFDLNDGVLHMEQCLYIIRTAVRNIAGQRVLILYIYEREKLLSGSIAPRWVMFQGREDFATLSFRENAPATWQCSPLDTLEKHYGFTSRCAFYQKQDETRTAHFCKCEANAMLALERLQWSISARRATERRQKKQRCIVQRMAHISPLPRDLKGFIRREVMPQYIFYDYQRKAPGRPYCTACRHEVAITKVKHNTTGSCPRCKRKITFKSRGRRGRIFDRATAQVLQKTRDGSLLLRIIKVYRTFNGSDLPSYYEAWENARQFITLSLCGQCSIDPYYHASTGRSDLTPWRCGYRPVFSQWQENFPANLCGVLYHRDLSDTLKDTPWVHSQLEAFACAISPLEVAPFLSAYIQQPKLEHLIKMKLFRLTASIVYGRHGPSLRSAVDFSGKNMRAMLGIDRSHFSFLQEIDPTADELRVIRSLLQLKPRPSTEQIRWFIAHEVTDIKTVKEILAYMSLHKLQRYLSERFTLTGTGSRPHRSMAMLLADYRDYLDMCRQLQYDTENTFVLFPRDLIEAHDRVVKELKDRHTAEQEKKIADSFDKWQEQYQFCGKELMVIPPHSAKEIADEGAALHHCVGRYVDRVAQEQCVILFVRKVSEPDKSLCTVEVTNGQVTQARGFGNAEPSATVREFIEQWKKRVLFAADKAAA